MRRRERSHNLSHGADGLGRLDLDRRGAPQMAARDKPTIGRSGEGAPFSCWPLLTALLLLGRSLRLFAVELTDGELESVEHVLGQTSTRQSLGKRKPSEPHELNHAQEHIDTIEAEIMWPKGASNIGGHLVEQTLKGRRQQARASVGRKNQQRLTVAEKRHESTKEGPGVGLSWRRVLAYCVHHIEAASCWFR